jgi:hypothetical protein
VLWESGTFDPGGVLIMQGDGNLVIYSPLAIWASNTDGEPGAHLLVQNDGNVVLYRADWTPIWDTGTVQP